MLQIVSEDFKYTSYVIKARHMLSEHNKTRVDRYCLLLNSFNREVTAHLRLDSDGKISIIDTKINR